MTLISTSVFRYGSGYSHAYGADGYHHYMRSHDPNYDAFYAEGPSVDERWRNTYPYVPTSYSQQSKQGFYDVFLLGNEYYS